MKYNILIGVLVSIFTISPSYAQDQKSLEQLDSVITNKKQQLLDTADNETKKKIKEDINKLKAEQKEAKKRAKEEAAKQKKALKEAKKLKKENKKAQDEVQESNDGKTINNNSGWTLVPVSKNEVQAETNHSNKIVSNSEHSSDKVNEPTNKVKTLEDRLEEIEKENIYLKKENENLRKQLNKLYTDNFLQKWGDKPFSKFDKAFLSDTLQISKSLTLLPSDIKKLSDDYTYYQEGWKCINNIYNEQAIKSVIGKIKTLRDKSNNPEKKKELAELHTKLLDYRGTVEVFQNLIKKLIKYCRDGKINLRVDETIGDGKIVDHDDIDIINDIPWLSEQLEKVKKEFKNGTSDKDGSVTNTILHLLDPKE